MLLHGRNPDKLAAALKTVESESDAGRVAGYLADLSRLSQVKRLAEQVKSDHVRLDGLITMPTSSEPAIRSRTRNWMCALRSIPSRPGN